MRYVKQKDEEEGVYVLDEEGKNRKKNQSAQHVTGEKGRKRYEEIFTSTVSTTGVPLEELPGGNNNNNNIKKNNGNINHNQPPARSTNPFDDNCYGNNNNNNNTLRLPPPPSRPTTAAPTNPFVERNPFDNRP